MERLLALPLGVMGTLAGDAHPPGLQVLGLLLVDGVLEPRR